eukprot:7795277-Lingulodinium_polyedra.AAC.1
MPAWYAVFVKTQTGAPWPRPPADLPDAPRPMVAAVSIRVQNRCALHTTAGIPTARMSGSLMVRPLHRCRMARKTSASVWRSGAGATEMLNLAGRWPASEAKTCTPSCNCTKK